MSASQEQKITEALINLDPTETLETFRGRSIVTIKQALGCSVHEAVAVLKDLESRKLIEARITPGGQLDIRKRMPVARWSWGNA
jgi:hypothetical protein